jgi:hypothetical protein
MANDRWQADEKAWEKTEGFRETLLLFFPRKNARALRRVARLLFFGALEDFQWDFARQGSWTLARLRAATRDLGHLVRFLRSTADSAEEELGLAPERKARLEELAARAAVEVGVIAAELEEELVEGEGACS